MTRLILGLIRLIAVSLSFILSSFAAAAFITFVLFLGTDLGWLNDDPLVNLGTLGFCLVAWATITQLTFVPFCAIIIVAEFTRMTSLLFNLLLGGACAFVILVLVPEISNGTGLPYPTQEIWLTCIAAGFIGGLSYWILAGHRAGRWLGPRPSPEEVKNNLI